MENLSLKDSEFQPERKVVAEERRWRTDNSPTGYVYFKLFNNAFIYHPYHWTPIGFVEDIKNWTIDDIKEFHKKYYTPSNAVIVVAGDISKEKVFASAKKYFNHIKNTKQSKTIKPIHTIEPKQNGEKRVIIHKKTQVQILAIAFHIPNYQHKDQVALNALSELLSSGKSSRLQELLIDQKQLVNTIYAYNMEQTDPGIYLFFAVCNPNVKAKEVEKLIWQEIEKIKQNNITKEELDKIKKNTKADFVFALENSSSVASLYGSYLARGDIKPLLEYEKNIKQLTTKKISNVAKKYFTKKNCTTIILKN
jgi:predicted Zn-dependent peptidase